MYYFIVKIFLTLLTCFIACAVVMHDWRKERQQLSFKERTKRIPNRYLFALIGVIISTLLSILTDAHEQHERFEEEIAQSLRDSIVRARIDSSLAVLYLVSAGLNATQEQIDDQGNQLMAGVERTTDELYGVSKSIDSGFENNLQRLVGQQRIIESVSHNMVLNQKIAMSNKYPISHWILSFVIAYPIPNMIKENILLCSKECDYGDPTYIGLKNPQCLDINCVKSFGADIYIPANPPLRLNVTDVDRGYTRLVELFVRPLHNPSNISSIHIANDTAFVWYRIRAKNSSTAYAHLHPKLNLWDLDSCLLELDINPHEMNWHESKGKIVSELLVDFDGSETSLRISPRSLCRNKYGSYNLNLRSIESYIDYTSMLWAHDKFGPFVFDVSSWDIRLCK